MLNAGKPLQYALFHLVFVRGSGAHSIGTGARVPPPLLQMAGHGRHRE